MTSDVEFESFLRRFRPVAPRPLRARRPKAPAAGASLAAAMTGLALAAAWWAEHRSPPRPATAFAAARASLDDPGRLNSLLDAESRRLLADVRDREGALRALAAVE